jgi:repressor LexA
MMTTQQAATVRFILDFQALHDGATPSFSQIQTHLNLASKSGVHRILGGLEDRGIIRRLPNRSRSIEVLDAPPDSQKHRMALATKLAARLEKDHAVPETDSPASPMLIILTKEEAIASIIAELAE